MKRAYPVLLLALLAATAQAELGGKQDSIAGDRAKMQSTAYRATPGRGYTLHTLQLPTGTTVREYVNAAGVVFAVAWTGPFPPDLHQLLGDSYYPQYHSEAHVGHGRHPVHLHNQGLMLESGGHGRQFAGHAWIPDLLPAGVNGTDLQ